MNYKNQRHQIRKEEIREGDGELTGREAGAGEAGSAAAFGTTAAFEVPSLGLRAANWEPHRGEQLVGACCLGSCRRRLGAAVAWAAELGKWRRLAAAAPAGHEPRASVGRAGRRCVDPVPPDLGPHRLQEAAPPLGIAP